MSPRRAKVLGGETSPGALRRHLIGVTQRLLAAHGVTGLTTRQIAREAQVADGVLYNHFAGKDDLVLTALTEQATQQVDEFLAAVPEPGSATLEANLTALGQAALAMAIGTVPLFTGLLGQERLLHGFFTGLHAEHGPQNAFSATIAYLRAEQALGRASDDVDAVAVAELLFGACQLRAFVGQMRPQDVAVPLAEPGEPEDLDAVVAVLIRALRPTP